MKPKKTKLFIPGLILFSIVIPANPDINSLTGHADRFMMTRILKAEDNRDEKQLLELARIGKKNKKNIIIRICHASGRIPSFKTWETLSGKHSRWQCITDALAIAARYPENKFPKDRVFKILINFPLSETVVETMLFLNTKKAFEFVLSLKRFRKTVARNLWRSKDYLTREILKTFYQQVPEATIYSIYRSRTKGLVQSGDIRNMNLHNQYYGCLVCDQPKEFLKDPAWQVRIAAVKAADSVESSKELLTDIHPLVRAAAMEVYLKKNGNPSFIQVDQLNVMEADILAPRVRHRILIKRIFDRNGLFSEVAAPYLDRSEKNMILSSTLSDKARVMFVENQMGKKNAISYAITLFQNQNSSFALQYLLFQKEGVQKDKIIKTAKEKGCFHSELQDFGYIKPKPVKRPLIFYAALLKEIHAYQGFNIITEKGIVKCQFFLQEAPLTCFNFIKLVNRQYFNHLIFHRVVPAFVAQDGDPTGTGSGGPGYTIRCEYNPIKYNQPGMVGMALTGKDTGGSQYFITHLATPHLNHQYTIFARVVSGMHILSTICQYDKIKQIILY